MRGKILLRPVEISVSPICLVYGAADAAIKLFFYRIISLNVLNLAIFDHFREIFYPRKVSKPQNREIKYLPSLRFSFS